MAAESVDLKGLSCSAHMNEKKVAELQSIRDWTEEEEEERDLDKNTRDDFGTTPFHLAAEQGHLEVCRLLMENIDEPLFTGLC